MTAARVAFVVCLVGLSISAMIVALLLPVYMPGATLIAVFIELNVALKLGAILLIGAPLTSLVLVVLHRVSGRRDAKLALVLRVVAGISVLIGALFALYGWIAIQAAIQAVGPARFAVMAPRVAEVALVLALGFLPAVIALLGAAPVRVERRGL